VYFILLSSILVWFVLKYSLCISQTETNQIRMLHIIRERKLSYDGQSPKHPKASPRIGNRFLSFSFQEMKVKRFLILDILGTDK